jgi:hypothetical protein
VGQTFAALFFGPIFGWIALAPGLDYGAITLGRPTHRSPSARPLPRVAVAVCAAAVALFAVVLWPSRSFAAIVPACEADFASNVAAPALEKVRTECDGDAARGDDIDNSRVAPMCDASGASAIAPPRIRNVSDVRLERHRPCEGGESLRAAVSPGRGDPPAHAPDAIVDRAMMPSPEVLSPAGQPRLIDPLARTDGPRAGVRTAVYHPPR